MPRKKKKKTKKKTPAKKYRLLLPACLLLMVVLTLFAACNLIFLRPGTTAVARDIASAETLRKPTTPRKKVIWDLLPAFPPLRELYTDGRNDQRLPGKKPRRATILLQLGLQMGLLAGFC